MSRKGLRLCALLSKGRTLRGWTWLRGKKFVRQMTGERQFTFCCHYKPSNALLCIYPPIVSGREKKAVLKNEVHKLMRKISTRPIDEDQEAGVRAHFVPEPKLSAGYFGPWAMGIIANTANDSFHPLQKPAKIELVELRNKPSTYIEITSLVRAYDFYSRVVKNHKRTSELLILHKHLFIIWVLTLTWTVESRPQRPTYKSRPDPISPLFRVKTSKLLNSIVIRRLPGESKNK